MKELSRRIQTMRALSLTRDNFTRSLSCGVRCRFLPCFFSGAPALFHLFGWVQKGCATGALDLHMWYRTAYHCSTLNSYPSHQPQKRRYSETEHRPHCYNI